MNRKGFISDIVLFVALMVLIAFAFLIVYVVFDGMNTAIQGNNQMPQKSKDTAQTFRDDFGNVWDWTFLTVFIAGIIGLLILSFVLRTNPAIFFAILMVVVLVAILAAALSNGWETATDTGVLETTATQFPVMDFVMNNLVTFVVVTAFLMLIVFFAKPGGEGI